MEILKHFDKIDNKDIHVYRLKEDALTDFIHELTDNFRLSYISDEELEDISSKNEMKKSEFLEQFVLPDKGNIKSGDFGEILSFHTVIEHFRTKGIRLIGPYKWMWKDRNKAAQYSDALLFGNNGTNDLIITIESKMKATPSKEHRIQDAINGAVDDKLTRMSNTLFWLQEKYARLGDVKNRKLAERYAYPSKYGSYDKVYKAIAIVDKDFEIQESNKEFTKGEDIIVLLFSINALKDAYEQTRQNIINSVD
ncbi:SAVED domain-containing protein [Balneolaceae bacterium ANBcel3]|nr:SAVED domain-containing protein [Balneolaceae bacterium ANBcel3]